MRSSIIVALATITCVQAVAAATVCGNKGYDDGTDSYYDDNQGTYTACAAACRKSSKCKSFAYGAEECHLYAVPVEGNFEADRDSPYTFYDASCSKASTTTTVTTTKASSSSTTSITTKSASTSSSKTTTLSTTTTKPTTSPSTTAKSTTTISTSTSSTTSPWPSATCSVDQRPSCTGQDVNDPCGQGCGCSYVEGCGGSIRPSTTDRNSVLAFYSGIAYSSCVKFCDANQPQCIGVNYAPTPGSCYLYNATAGTGPAPGAWFALRNSCAKPCPHA